MKALATTRLVRCLVFLGGAVLGLLPTTVPAAAPSTAAPAPAALVFPGQRWETVPTAALGAQCRSQLDATRRYLQTLDTTALVAVQAGKVLLSYGPTEQVSIVFSVRKSVLAMLYGKYVAAGTVDIERSLADLAIDDVGGLLPIERQSRLRDLLTARSGVYHPASNPGDDAAFAPPRGSQVPGTYFLYNNWDFNAAETAFERLTHQSLYRAFADDLARPLQLEDFDPARQRPIGNPAKSEHLAHALYLSTRDMARLGYLMLRQGAWRGRQLVPAEWVSRTTTTVTLAAAMHPAATARRGFGYGYLWWTLDAPAASPFHGAYMAMGAQGQYILVLPARDMVVAHKRQVPVAGQWNLSWVRPDDFLAAARMLADAPCD